MDENTLKVLYRIKTSSDGNDLINFLIQLSKDNYKAWKIEGGDVLRGKAIMLDHLLELFDTCSISLENLKAPQKEWL